MASQLAIELTLEQAANCIYVAATDTVTGVPTYSVANVNLIPEILQFDASYGNLILIRRCNVFEGAKRWWSSY
jgi:hypothetical protein